MPLPKVFLVEYGSSYDSDPWQPMVVCPTEVAARYYIDITCRKCPGLSPSLFHITEVTWYEST